MTFLHKQIGHIHSYAYLAIIVLCAAALRLIRLASNPLGFYVDEASTGYDAYSIMLTGRDQYGEFLPMFARTFGAYNESLYRFLTVIPVRLFGLNEFAVRLPAAIVGILTVVVMYFLAKAFFNEKVGLLTALLLTISPWHLQFSRAGFRAILLPFFFCLGLLFFLKGVQGKPRYLWISSFMFSVSLYTYASARVFVPLFLLSLLFLFWQELKSVKRETFVSACIFLAVFLFLTQYWLSPQGVAESVDSLKTSPMEWIKLYATYYTPQFLFIDGDPIARHNIANFGQLYQFELVTVLWGLVLLLRERQQRSWLFLAWLILYPLPGALTEAEHALRTIIGAPLFSLISAYGLYRILVAYKGKRGAVLMGLTTLVMLTSVAWYIQWYFVIYPIYSPKAWQYGMREAITYSESQPYKNVYISDNFFIPHMFVLFYTEYPPEVYHREALFDVGEGEFRYTDVAIGKYRIMAPHKMWQVDKENALFLVFPDEVTYITSYPFCEEVHTIYRPDNSIASKLVECTP